MSIGRLLAAVLCVMLSAHVSGQAPTSAPAIPLQARSVAVWFMAVKAGDQEQLKTVFSETMRRQFEREGWDSVARTYREVFTREFGDYTLEEFSFAFKGDESRGYVSVAHKGRTLPGVMVIYEKSEWKVNER